MKAATDAAVSTRDGKLRAPVPTGQLGTSEFLDVVDGEVLEKAWAAHKKAVEGWPRSGLGLDVDIAIRPSQLSG